jgi:hypothetical protein
MPAPKDIQLLLPRTLIKLGENQFTSSLVDPKPMLMVEMDMPVDAEA